MFFHLGYGGDPRHRRGFRHFFRRFLPGISLCPLHWFSSCMACIFSGMQHYHPPLYSLTFFGSAVERPTLSGVNGSSSIFWVSFSFFNCMGFSMTFPGTSVKNSHTICMHTKAHITVYFLSTYRYVRGWVLHLSLIHIWRCRRRLRCRSRWSPYH